MCGWTRRLCSIERHLLLPAAGPLPYMRGYPTCNVCICGEVLFGNPRQHKPAKQPAVHDTARTDVMARGEMKTVGGRTFMNALSGYKFRPHICLHCGARFAKMYRLVRRKWQCHDGPHGLRNITVMTPYSSDRNEIFLIGLCTRPQSSSRGLQLNNTQPMNVRFATRLPPARPSCIARCALERCARAVGVEVHG